MPLISLGKLDKKIIIPIIGGIAKLVYRFLYDLNEKGKNLNENPLIRGIYAAFGMVLSIIPFFILKIQTKKSLNKNNDMKSENLININNSKFNIELIHYNIYEKQRFLKYKLILLSSIFDFSQSLINILFCTKCVYNLWVLDIIILTFFSFLILRSKIYNHQYLSIIMIIIFGFGLNIIEYFKINDKDKIIVSEILWKLVTEISFCGAIIISKYNMEKTFCTIYEIIIWNGIGTLILKIVCLLIFNKIKIKIDNIQYPDNFERYINQFNYYDLYIAIITNVYSFFFNISIFFALDHFTAFHPLIVIIINEFYPYFKINEKTILNIIGFVIILLILIIFLVFIEILELNFWDLSKYTKKNITLRSRKDSLSALSPIEFEERISENNNTNNIDEK